MAKKDEAKPGLGNIVTVAAQKFLAKILNRQVIEFKLKNGLKVVCHRDKIHPDVIEDLIMHGVSQKVGDAAAKYSKANDFHGAFSAMQTIVDNLEAGIWSSRGTGTADLAQAMFNLGLGEMDQIEAGLRLATEEELEVFTSDVSVKAEIAKIKAERAKGKAEQAEPADLKKLWKAISKKGAAV